MFYFHFKTKKKKQTAESDEKRKTSNWVYAGMRIVGHSIKHKHGEHTHIWSVRALLNCTCNIGAVMSTMCNANCAHVCLYADVCTIHVVDALLSQPAIHPTDTIHRMHIELCNIFVFGVVCIFSSYVIRLISVCVLWSHLISSVQK